ncbi:hypothetical protein NW762_011303 [Fusarium torreyae]|uniref:Uncharacterized protein n=1 Tax=Fusarium torreyae TaxID=1237075 RepID=A0A9W8VA28_9HYPO|nr:hypothetical protein NW762_011303 [Fusarium torreyae]
MSDNAGNQPERFDHSTVYIPIPYLPRHRFSQSAVEVGRLIRDAPLITGNRSIVTRNRTKNSKGYLKVERRVDRTGFLWCDSSGQAVKKSYIKTNQPFSIWHVKEALVEKYNEHEKERVREYTRALCIALSRRRIVKFAQRGTAQPPGVDDEERIEQYLKEEVLCHVSDPELN